MATDRIKDWLRRQFPGAQTPEFRRMAYIVLGMLGALCVLKVVMAVLDGGGGEATPVESVVQIDTPRGVEQENFDSGNQFKERSNISVKPSSGGNFAEEIYNQAGDDAGTVVMEGVSGQAAEPQSSAPDGDAGRDDRGGAARMFDIPTEPAVTPATEAGPGLGGQGTGARQAAPPAYPQPTYAPEPEAQPVAQAEPVQTPSDDGRVEVLPGSSVRRSGGLSSLDDAWGTVGTGVSSLGSETASGQQDSRSHPFEVMFSQTEKISGGGRVMLRLLEDMIVDGQRIPKNSPLSGICSVGGNRLKIVVPALKVNDKIYSLNMVAYDTDGMEGLYCPQTGANRTAKEGRREAGNIVRSVLQSGIAGYAGQVVSSGAQLIQNSSGDVTITVTQGYKFYLMKGEN